MKKVYTLSLTLATALFLSSCGSLSGDDEDVQVATAYYHNIEGVEYDCGDAPKGTTDSSGRFLFEEGENCTFYVGDKELREVSNRVLSDGAILVETNDANIQLLQTLDNDANPFNGIKILSGVADYFEVQDTVENFLPEFFTDLFEVNRVTMATLSTALELISGYDGESVSVGEARDNLNNIIEELEADNIDYIELQ